uniref:Transmembrane protein n=1 Tax=Steinernema glaseri TaxID=37863 RepID=A0A1I7YY16_9BILA
MTDERGHLSFLRRKQYEAHKTIAASSPGNYVHIGESPMDNLRFNYNSTMCCLMLRCSCHPKRIGAIVLATEVCKLVFVTCGLVTSSSRYTEEMFTPTDDLWDTLIFLTFWLLISLGVGTLLIGIVFEHSTFLVPTLISQMFTIIALLLLPYFRDVSVVSSCMTAFVQLLILIVFLVCYVDIAEVEKNRANWDDRQDVYTSQPTTINGRVFGTKLYRTDRSKRRIVLPMMPLQKLNELDEGAMCNTYPEVIFADGSQN